jgi:hypothetical protein
MKLGRIEKATHDPYYRETAYGFSEIPIGELQQKTATGNPNAQNKIAGTIKIDVGYIIRFEIQLPKQSRNCTNGNKNIVRSY